MGPLTRLILHRVVPEHEVSGALSQINCFTDKTQLEQCQVKMYFGKVTALLENYTL